MRGWWFGCRGCGGRGGILLDVPVRRFIHETPLRRGEVGRFGFTSMESSKYKEEADE